MSLFSKKQPAPVRKPELPTLPEFPDIPEENSVPSYESTLDAIKREVGTETDIPFREPARERRLPSLSAEFNTMPVTPVAVPSVQSDDKPVFVKLDNYKEALAQLTELKKKVDEAETLIAQLEQLKNEEAMRLENWKHNVQSIKDKLLSIDKGLFEA